MFVLTQEQQAVSIGIKVLTLQSHIHSSLWTMMKISLSFVYGELPGRTIIFIIAVVTNRDSIRSFCAQEPTRQVIIVIVIVVGRAVRNTSCLRCLTCLAPRRKSNLTSWGWQAG